MYGNLEISSVTMHNLADINHMYGIAYLDIRSTQINDEGISYFFQHKNSELLTYLDMSSNFEAISDKSLTSIAESQHCKGLKVLKVANCSITD